MKRIKPDSGPRLALNKETLRTLGDADLNDVAGGGITGPIILSSIILTATITSTVTLTPGPNTTTNPPAPDPEPEPDPEPKTETPG